MNVQIRYVKTVIHVLNVLIQCVTDAENAIVVVLVHILIVRIIL